MDKQMLISEILVTLRSDRTLSDHARVELITFFEAARRPLSFIRWLLFRAPRISRNGLLELSDTGDQRWDEIFYKQMIEVERSSMPGFVRPLVDRLHLFITKNAPITVLHIGCGPMEIERQVIERLLNSNQSVHFVGIDQSEISIRWARENLSKVLPSESIQVIPDLNDLTPVNDVRVSLCVGEALALIKMLPNSATILIVHSLFRHHLTTDAKEQLDRIIAQKEFQFLEYDGYRSWPNMIPASFNAWWKPVLLNGALFSNLRYDTRREVATRCPGAVYYWFGTYLFERTKN